MHYKLASLINGEIMNRARIAIILIAFTLTLACVSHAGLDDTPPPILKDARCESTDVYICLEELIQKKRTDEQVRNRFRDLYILAEKRATSCTSIKDTAQFLKVSKVNIWGSHTRDAYNISLELLLRSKPACFFDAMLLLDNQSRNSVFDKLLNPLGLTSYEVDTIFEQYKNKDAYKELVEIYFNLRSK